MIGLPDDLRPALRWATITGHSRLGSFCSKPNQVAVTGREQKENRVLYDNQNFVFRGEFEFANDPRNFFNEEDPAVQRMARSFAESIVSTLVNGFGIKNDK